MVAEPFLLGVGVCLLFLGVAVRFLLFSDETRPVLF
jgi:hypothetical protein